LVDVKDLFYRVLMLLARRFGNGVFLLIAWFVATGYFLFFPRRVAVSVRFYRNLFPARSWGYWLGCAWQQYHRFVHVFLDRFRLAEGNDLVSTCEGWEHLVEAVRSGRGAVVLMSHVGSWEIAAQLLRRMGKGEPGMRLLLYLGAKHEEQIEGRQKRSIAKSGIRIVSVPEGGGSAMDILEGLNFLRGGGLVSLTGDRLWGREQRSVAVRFAGSEARIPEIPYRLAVVSGAPLVIFFGYRVGRGRYHLVARPPLHVTPASRAEHAEAIQAAAQRYADDLEATVRAHPGEWFHFEPFLAIRNSQAH
jgi:predicted LPLAT superfamily acyltransferase